MKNIKVLSGVLVLAVGASFGGIAQAATATSQTTIEKSTTIEPVTPSVNTNVREEHSTTTTKKGLFGRKKEVSSSSSTRYERDPAPATSSEVKSKTTIETERSRY